MTSTPAHDSNKTLQIALVGVRPADQVMLKGYMRVILRLDTGLEWVSANHPTVDFYIVNYEFAQADSIKKVLANQPNAAILYVQRDEAAGGGLVDDVLTLPLKELDQLKYWLSTHIASLHDLHHGSPPATGSQQTASNTTAPTATNNPATNSPANNGRLTLDEILANRATSPATAPSTGQVAPASHLAAPPATTVAPDQLVNIFRQLQQGGDNLVTLVSGSDMIGYIHPARQRIWVMNDLAVLTPELKLVANNNQPSLDSQPSEDLAQWLWAKAYDMPATSISQLAKPDIRYHITSWIKPLSSQPSHEILKLQCVLEARDVTLSELAQLAQTSREVTMRTVAGLVASGVMQSSVYSQLKNIPTIDSVLDTIPLDSTAFDSTPSQASALAQLGTGMSNGASIFNEPAQASQPAQADEGMKGFLSKLRRKLGL